MRRLVLRSTDRCIRIHPTDRAADTGDQRIVLVFGRQTLYVSTVCFIQPFVWNCQSEGSDTRTYLPLP